MGVTSLNIQGTDANLGHRAFTPLTRFWGKRDFEVICGLLVSIFYFQTTKLGQTKVKVPTLMSKSTTLGWGHLPGALPPGRSVQWVHVPPVSSMMGFTVMVISAPGKTQVFTPLRSR
jgi:hypothetical protein